MLDPYDEWTRECERAAKSILDVPFEERANEAIYAAERLRALAFGLAGVACSLCGGLGEQSYPSSST